MKQWDEFSGRIQNENDLSLRQIKLNNHLLCKNLGNTDEKHRLKES